MLNRLAFAACVELYLANEFRCRNRTAIAKLPRGEFVELERWFDAERNRLWDRQIEEDAQSGKLRELYQRLQSENQGQPHVPLDEFLDNEKLS